MHFDLTDLIAKYDLSEFVETGYGQGDGVRAALAAGFDSVTSIEIVSPVAEKAGHEWAEDDDRVTILDTNSYDGLSLVCQKTKGPICFWLDAYLPSHYGYTLPADEFNTPLETELEVIFTARDAAEDVILIGGLSLYERGCSAPLDAWKQFTHTHTKFIERLFGATHDIHRDFTGTGYVTLTPKKQVAFDLGSDAPSTVETIASGVSIATVHDAPVDQPFTLEESLS